MNNEPVPTPHDAGKQHDYHQEKHLTSSDTLKDVVIGMADGLTVPFALAAGLSGAVSSCGIITTAGVAEVAAGAIAMGLGGYLAGQTEVDHYASELKREYWEIEHKRTHEIQEVKDAFMGMGLSNETADKATQELIQDKDKWVSFMMRHELGLDEPDPKRATQSAFNIGLSYIVGGIVPLSPYFFVNSPNLGLQYSAAVTLLCLLVFGYYKSRMTGQNVYTGALKTAAIGAIAACAAFFIAKWIG